MKGSLIGRKVPDLMFPASTGGEIAPARVPGCVVLYLYPYTGRPGVPDPPRWDDIPGAHGSTPEAQGFAAHHEAYARAGVTVYGLSGQSPAWQREFALRLALPFALLSDEPLALARVLGLPTFETGGVSYLERLTLVIRDGVIVDVAHPVLRPGTHAADLLMGLDGPGLVRP